MLWEGEPEELELEDNGNDRDLQAVRDLLYYCWAPIVPTIHSLMIYDTSLIVIASGYMQSIQAELDYDPAFYDAFATKILIYDISSLDKGKPALLMFMDNSIVSVPLRTEHILSHSQEWTPTHTSMDLWVAVSPSLKTWMTASTGRLPEG